MNDSEPVVVSLQSAWSVLKINSTNPLFEESVKIRSSHSNTLANCTDPFDDNADIYLLVHEGVSVATMRINQARRGSLDCEDFYPVSFLARFRSVVSSASRFARSASTRPDRGLMSRFIYEIRRDQFTDGMRVDLINVHLPMIPYYKRLGYKLLCNSYFQHPRLGTDSCVMCLIVTPDTANGFEDSFATQADLSEVHEIGRALKICDPVACQFEAIKPVDGFDRFACSSSRFQNT